MRSHRVSPLLVLASLALALPGAPARAEVNLVTGQYSQKAVDLPLSGGIEPSLERFYKSDNPAVGIFGRGWMSGFEASLSFEENGDIVFHEEASAEGRRFLPLDSATPSARDAAQVPVGRRYETRCPFQHLERTATGFQLVYDGGRTLSFDAIGRLTRVENRSGNFFRVEYGPDGRPSAVTDDGNRSVTFTYGARGFVTKAKDSSGREATYDYGPDGALARVKNASGTVHYYRYEAAPPGRLRGSSEENAAGETISYDAQGRVEAVEEDGASTEYFYARSPDHVLRVDTRTTSGTAPISQSTYEYELFDTGYGDEGVLRLRTVEDGFATDTRYNACCGRVTSIQRGEELVTFSYDEGGHLVRKAGPTGETSVRIDPASKKVAEVHQLSRDGKELHWARFQYDAGANLVHAEDSDGKRVSLTYDAKGRIQHMEDQDGRVLEFEYNAASRPTVIKDPAIGAIRVTYDAAGEIEKTDSDGGRKVALSVTSAFQNLLDVIRPANVSETF